MNTKVASAIEVMKLISWQLYCVIYSDLMKVWMLEMKGISQYRYITLMRKEESHIIHGKAKMWQGLYRSLEGKSKDVKEGDEIKGKGGSKWRKIAASSLLGTMFEKGGSELELWNCTLYCFYVISTGCFIVEILL